MTKDEVLLELHEAREIMTSRSRFTKTAYDAGLVGLGHILAKAPEPMLTTVQGVIQEWIQRGILLGYGGTHKIDSPNE